VRRPGGGASTLSPMFHPRFQREFVEQLVAARAAHAYPVHLRTSAQAFGERALAFLFPHFAADGEGTTTQEHVELEGARVAEALIALLDSLSSCVAAPLEANIPQRFADQLPTVYALLNSDAEALFRGDPAARSVDEVVLTYPGFYAIAVYRIAHALHGLGVPLLPRMLTELAHSRTGVDIHPGARIGRSFFIDHGTGVVVGETTVIGDSVKLYQGVTLGALVVEKEMASQKRHPTLEDNVVVYSNATILGGSTVVGHDSVIGGNAFLTESVAPFSLVTHQSEVRSRRSRGTGELEFQI